MRLVIASSWDGLPVALAEQVSLELAWEAESLCVRIDAPFNDDPAPPPPPGSTPGLWNYEAVELMLLGAEDRYLELEFGPHGHYLAIALCGPRQVTAIGMQLSFTARIVGGRFLGQARVPLGWLPLGLSRVNAFALHGVESQRRYLAWRGAPGKAPDFHRLELFGELEPAV